MRKLLLSLVSFIALCALIGCGTSNNTISIPPNPSGGNAAGFSNTSLASGTSYVFSVSGLNTTGSFAVVGTFVTDGNGNITAGIRDTVNDAGGQNLGEAIDTVNSSYFVNRDGRGQLVLTGPSGRVIYRFVLHAPTAQQPSLVGELFQDGTTSDRVIVDAVGIIEQVSPIPVATPTGSYVVRLDGEDPNLNPYGAIGGITFNANNLTGSIDENDNGGYAQETQPLAANGTIALSSSRGTATLTTPSGINPATHNFVVYYISPTHLELVSTDRNFFLYGSATQQASFAASNAAFASNQVFALSGVDNSGPQNSPAPRVELGRLTLNGDGSLSNAIEDYSNFTFTGIYLGGSLTQNSSYTVGANGRWTANLVNATYASSTALVGWQVSFDAAPQDQKSFILTTNSNILETGVALGQTLGLTDANVSGNYAESLSGVNVSGQGPDFAEFVGNLDANGAGTFNNSSSYDVQTDFSGLFTDNLSAGTYTIDPTQGRSTTANLQNIPVALYSVDADTLFFVSAQQGDIYQGAIINQQ
jgi:hypothetical protein